MFTIPGMKRKTADMKTPNLQRASSNPKTSSQIEGRRQIKPSNSVEMILVTVTKLNFWIKKSWATEKTDSVLKTIARIHPDK